jgi:hypothetical protein
MDLEKARGFAKEQLNLHERIGETEVPATSPEQQTKTARLARFDSLFERIVAMAEYRNEAGEGHYNLGVFIKDTEVESMGYGLAAHIREVDGVDVALMLDVDFSVQMGMRHVFQGEGLDRWHIEEAAENQPSRVDDRLTLMEQSVAAAESVRQAATLQA